MRRLLCSVEGRCPQRPFVRATVGPLRAAALYLLIALALLAGACRREKPAATNLAAANQVAARTVKLYFESPEMLLAAEMRNVQLPQNPAGALALVVRELFKGSANAAVPRLFPPDTVVRGAYLLPDGTAFVDVGGATISSGWTTGSHQEMMAVYSVVQTVLSNFPEVRRVRFLINGEPAETLAGHISLEKPLGPLAALVDPQRR